MQSQGINFKIFKPSLAFVCCAKQTQIWKSHYIEACDHMTIQMFVAMALIIHFYENQYLLPTWSLKIEGVNEIDTSVSPDVEYFHSCHFAYHVIIAIILTITIVIGLPLLHRVKPLFLTFKIYFVKIKPTYTLLLIIWYIVLWSLYL